MNCSNNKEAYSFHPGGIVANFADGHVSFLHEALSVQTYASLISRDGGEVLPAASY